MRRVWFEYVSRRYDIMAWRWNWSVLAIEIVLHGKIILGHVFMSLAVLF